VVAHLIKRGEVIPGSAVALGDRPAGNDEGLTRWHRADKGEQIPFIAVTEHPELVPDWMADTHVRRLSNAEASAAVLHGLADRLVALGDGDCWAQMGGSGSVQASTGIGVSRKADGRGGAIAAIAVDDLDIGELVREIVRKVNQDVV
jgi:hypothetical protein